MMKFRSLLLTAALACSLVSMAHAQAIIGAWSYGDTLTPGTEGTGVIVFLDNGVYFHAESENTDDAENGHNGMERGTYTWDSGTGAFTSNTIVNTNGQWGMSHDTPSPLTISGGILTVHDGEEQFLLSSVTGASPIVGAWTFGNTLNPDSSGTGVIVFLGNGVYFHAESENVADAANGPTGSGPDDFGFGGMERGTYTWDSGNSLLTLTSVAVNTNGQWGLSDDPGVGNTLSLSVSGNSMLVDGETTLTRVVAVPEPSTWALMLTGSALAGFAAWRRRRAA